MKKMTLIAAFVAATLTIKAQDCTYYFPVKKGTTMEMKSYNAKEKQTGSSKSTITDRVDNSVKFNSEVFDEKGKSIAKGNYEVKCENGEFIIDMNQFLKGMDLSAYQGMEIKMESKQLTIPSKLTTGQQLNDGSVKVAISNPMMTMMNINIKITNRKVEGFEDVTTPAGTFHCAKITYNIESKIMVNTLNKGIEFLSDKVGTVRSETYNSNDKLLDYTILTSYKD